MTPLGVVDHALEINDDGGFITDGPGIVTRGQQRDIAWFAVEFGAVIHQDMEDA